MQLFLRAAVALWATASVVTADECPSGYTSSPNPPKSALTWTSCATDDEPRLQCAVLKVPLDYTNIATGGTLEIPVVRVPAPNNTASAKSIFYNPGGPGSSPVKHFVNGTGTYLQDSYGPSFNWVTFDPRGVGLTIPFTCKGVPNANGTSLSYDNPAGMQALYQNTLNQGKACQSQFQSTTGELMGTAFVARDIKALFESLGEDGLIRYLGYSYGTLLGATVGAMFPDKIDRLVLDGNVNPVSWYHGLREDRPDDSDKAMGKFFELCAEAPDDCDLSVSGENGADLQKTFVDFYTALDAGSITAKDDKGRSVTSRSVRATLFGALYKPREWQKTATIIYGYYNTTAAKNNSTSTRRSTSLEPRQFDPNSGVATPFAITGIQCSDWWGVALPSASPALFQQWRQIFNAKSTFAGDVVVTNPISCANWQMNAREKYSGGFAGIETRNPVLVVQTPYDPITPMSSGRNVSAAFKGSALLVHDAVGHCSSASYGNGTAARIASYFKTGMLPDVTVLGQPDKPNPYVAASEGEGEDEDEDQDEFDDPYDGCEDEEDESEECEVDPEGGLVSRKRAAARRSRALAKLSAVHQRDLQEWENVQYPRQLLALAKRDFHALKARQYVPAGCVPINSTSTGGPYYAVSSSPSKSTYPVSSGTTKTTATVPASYKYASASSTWSRKTTASVTPGSPYYATLPPSSSKTYASSRATTVYTTALVNICPTGLTTVPVTITAYCPSKCTAVPSGVPQGYTTTVVYCSACATPSTVTITTKITATASATSVPYYAVSGTAAAATVTTSAAKMVGSSSAAVVSYPVASGSAAGGAGNATATGARQPVYTAGAASAAQRSMGAGVTVMLAVYGYFFM